MKAFRSIFIMLFCLSVTLMWTNVSNASQVESVTEVTIQNAVDLLNKYHDAQVQAGIQDPNLSYAMRKALALSDLLFSPDGQFESDLCQAVKPFFISSHAGEYEDNIARVLDKLDATWTPFFDSITKPQDPNNISNLVLRALYSLKSEEALMDRHAKVAVLAALFAPMNQGPVGDCFAVSGLIRDHAEYYRHSLEDYAQIVQKGYLTRTVNTELDNFFFLPVIADSDSSRTFYMDASGNIAHTNIPLFNAPGFAAAFNLMNGTQVPNLFQEITHRLFLGVSSDLVQTTPLQVISTCADVIAGNQPALDKGLLIEKGLFAFSCLTNNPILRGTECAFAAMAEDRTQDSIRGNINDCVALAMASQWYSLGSTSASFKTAFADSFNASYRLVYNSSIPLAQVSADGSSTDGGFQLYQRLSDRPEDIGVRVATPEDFRQLVLGAIAIAKSKEGASAQVSAMASQLAAFVSEDEFLQKALWAYDAANLKEKDPVNNYLKLARTPMQSCDGDNPYEVDDIDTGVAFDSDVQEYTPSNTQALLQWCLDLSKKAPEGLFPMNSPQHAFNFVPGISDIQSFQKSGLTSTKWIKQALVVPGMTVATKIMDAATKKTLADSVLNILSQVLTDHDGYQALTTKLAGQKLTTQRYAQKLLSGVNSLLWLDSDQKNELAILLDQALLEALPINDANVIRQTAVRFAMTNWNDGTKNIYFCAYFNPRTTHVAFGNIEEDKTHLQPMDEQAWVNHQRWDVDIRSYDSALLATGS